MALELMSFCNICPRECGVNRGEGPGGCGHPSLGICGQGPDSKIALVSKHDWEEPPISGTRGSGTIFFSGCNLRCKYCQNFDVSRGRIGKIVSVKRLAEIFLEQQTRGMHNINLVTPTHFLLSIIEALKMAREQGLHIPVVYNTSGYEKPEAIKALDGLVDIYLSDFKYADDELGKKLSAVRDYSKCADLALDTMYDSVGSYV
ncbi:MAG: radical SAM protein, partial [Clostridia bacterium]|nr:radical SAM protein [Clostridia bacterium]